MKKQGEFCIASASGPSSVAQHNCECGRVQALLTRGDSKCLLDYLLLATTF